MKDWRTWAKVIAVKGFPWLPLEGLGGAGMVETTQLPRGFGAPVEAKSLIRSLCGDGKGKPALFLIDRELSAGRVASVFGFSDRRRGVAVVSSARLRDPASEERTARRIANVADHELGHLNGLGHCRHAECLMYPAKAPDDVDARGDLACERCRNRTHPLLALVALAACLGAFLCVDQASLLLPPPESHSPFTVLQPAAGENPQLLFNGRPVLRSASLVTRQREITDQLNAAFQQVPVQQVGIESASGSRATLLLNGSPLLEVTARDAGAATPAAAACEWAEDLRQLLRSKGNPGSVCAECHIGRYSQVVAWHRSHAR